MSAVRQAAPAWPSREELEAPEIAGYRDLWTATPPDLRAQFGIRYGDVAGVSCTVVEALPHRRELNHALGLGALSAATLDALERFYGEHGAGVPAAVPAGHPGEEPLARRGYRPEYAWTKFARSVSPPPPVSAGLDVRAVEPADAGRMGDIISTSFDLPAAFGAWFGTLVGRPDWHCLGAYDGDDLVATGSLFVHGRAGWVTWAATDPAHRGRRAQKALLAARIDLGRRLGLELLVVETGERVPGRVDASYRNILAAGFEPVFRRPFWRGPAPAAQDATTRRAAPGGATSG